MALVSTRSSDLAAGQLGVSVATLKRRLARLEDVVGEKLFHGYADDFSLTKRGETLALSLYQMDEISGSDQTRTLPPKEGRSTAD